MKKLLPLLAALLVSSSSVFSVELTFRLTPGIAFPTGNNFKVGGTGQLQADVDMFGFLTAGLEGVFSLLPLDGLNQTSYIYGGGLGLGGYYYPLSRLYLGAGAGAGIYQFTTSSSSSSQTYSDIYWRAYGEVGFRFTPEFTLCANAGFSSFLLAKSHDVTTNQISAGVGIRYTMPIGKNKASGVILSSEQEDSVFPLFMSAYKQCPVTNVIIRNNNGAEITDVKLSLRAGRYSASTYESPVIARINKYSSEEIPMFCDFSTEILRFTENGKILCELTVEYSFLGKKMRAVQNMVLSVYSRNAFTWSDSTALSSFIAPNVPEILEVSKYIAGIARNNFYTGMNRNIQMAAAMHEALRLGGVKYSNDKLTPYTSYHLSDELDYIQYPLQTLNSLSGDYDELGILLSTFLQSVGVPTGYIPLDDDFIVLVSTGTAPGTEGNLFANTDGLVIDDESVYFGLSMANFEKGFAKSRAEASRKIQAALSNEDSVFEYTKVSAAWDLYKPAVFSENGTYFETPTATAITERTVAAIKDYINSDLTQVLARARTSGDSNKIGVALMRMGRYSEAKTEFNKAGTVKALNNLATVYMIEKNYTAAASTYKKVLAKEPDNRIALKGLENANAKLGL